MAGPHATGRYETPLSLLRVLVRLIREDELYTPAGRHLLERADALITPHGQGSGPKLVIAEDERETWAALQRPSIHRAPSERVRMKHVEVVRHSPANVGERLAQLLQEQAR